MRYYKIVITDPDGNLVVKPSSVPGSGATYTSFANNQSIPGALHVEMDIPLKAYATPMKGSMLRVWGISLAEISAASDFNPKLNEGKFLAYGIKIYGGMQQGLPLANPAQAGLLVQGVIFQAFGNWIGTDMTLDFILGPDLGTNPQPKNFSFNWLKNTPLSDAIRQMLKDAYPGGAAPIINISPNLTQNCDEQGVYSTLEQFSAYIKQRTAALIGGSYPGVDIYFDNNTFSVSDQTTAPAPIKIAFQDLIGQPTWIEGPTIQFKCVMRGDIAIGAYTQLPATVVTTTASAPSSLVNLKSAFEGTFYINEVRHVGCFRQPDAASWVTTFNGSPTLQQAA